MGIADYLFPLTTNDHSKVRSLFEKHLFSRIPVELANLSLETITKKLGESREHLATDIYVVERNARGEGNKYKTREIMPILNYISHHITGGEKGIIAVSQDTYENSESRRYHFEIRKEREISGEGNKPATRITVAKITVDYVAKRAKRKDHKEGTSTVIQSKGGKQTPQPNL